MIRNNIIRNIAKSDLLILLFFSCIFIFYPIKVFKNGEIQITNYFTLFFTFTVILFNKKTFVSLIKKKQFKYLGLFSLWTLFINIIYGYKLSDPKFLGNAYVYISYFLFATASMVVLIKYEIKLVSIFVWTNLLTLIVISIYILYFSYEENSIATFNNKNQLAHWVLFVPVSFALIYKNYKTLISSKIYILVLSLCVCLSYLSISRAASGGLLMLLLIIAIKNIRLILYAVILSLGILSIHYLIGPSKIDRDVKKIEKKYLKSSSKYDSFMGRGYWRILKYPQYIVFGAGEKQSKKRFNDKYEIHSSYGNILFSYGIVGFLLLFGAYYYNELRWDLLLVFPLLFLSLFHNNLRSPFIWLFPVFYYYISYKHKLAQ